MEIIIAMALFTLSAAGLYSAFISANRWIQPTSNNQNIATYVAGGELEKLYPAVRQDWWDGAGHPLTVTGGDQLEGTVVLDGVTYTKRKNVSAVNGATGYRKVVETISW